MQWRALAIGLYSLGALFVTLGINRSDVGYKLGGAVLIVAGLFVRKFGEEALSRQAELESKRSSLERQVGILTATNDALADGLQVALFLGDERGMISHANRKAREMFRFEEAAGRTLLTLTLSYDLEQLMIECVSSREPIQRELVLSYPEERNVLCDVWLENETSNKVYLSVYEVTDLRRLERVRQDFVANVSHELRTPLTTIRLMAESLADEPKPPAEQVHKSMQRVMSEVDRLAALAGDLLVLSSAEQNTVSKRECDIAAIVRSAIDMLGSHATEKDIALDVDIPESLPLQANPGQITQVVINLIDNAIKYTNRGSVRVRLSRVNGKAVFEVADTGIGVASEHQSRLFERFYRVDKGRSKASGGTGLGLSIVRHIVEAHGGQVQLESALNEGSKFTVTLPMVESGPVTEPTASQP